MAPSTWAASMLSTPLPQKKSLPNTPKAGHLILTIFTGLPTMPHTFILRDFLSNEWLFFLNCPLFLFFVAVCFFQKIGRYHIPCSALTHVAPFVEVQLNCKVRTHHSGTKWDCRGNAGRADPKVMCGQGAFVIYFLYELNKCMGRNKGW